MFTTKNEERVEIDHTLTFVFILGFCEEVLHIVYSYIYFGLIFPEFVDYAAMAATSSDMTLCLLITEFKGILLDKHTPNVIVKRDGAEGGF